MFPGSIARPLLLVAAAATAVTLAAGCSATRQPGTRHAGSGTAAQPSPRQAVELTAAHARTATSATATVSLQATGTIAMTIAGTVAERTTPSLLAQATFPTVQVAGQTIPGGMSEITSSTALYLRLSYLRQLSGDKTWIELPYSEMTNLLGGINLGTLIQQAQDNGPLLQTQLLGGATGVRKVGTGTIGGVPVTEYAGTYTMADAIAQLPASARSGVAKQSAQAGIKAVDFKVWVDDQQQARKLVLNEPTGMGDLTMTMLVTSINQPVSIELPPASQTIVAPFSALTSGF